MSNHTMRTALPWFIISLAIVIRFGIWVANPPGNSYDDHLTAIDLYATELNRPAPNECWECYQPPLYYVMGATVLSLTQPLEVDPTTRWKLLQLLSALASSLALIICWLVLRDHGTPGATFALISIAFLPRDIYTSAMVSNDALLVFWVALAIWGFYRFRQRSRVPVTWLPIGALAIGCLGAAFTKQSGLITACLPVWLLAESVWNRHHQNTSFILCQKETALLVVVLLLMPHDEIWRTVETGIFLASNQDLFGSPTDQLPGNLSAVSFADFRIEALAHTPRMSVETIGSFWTELYARFWSDYEPKFFPVSTMTDWLARTLLLAGLVPTLLAFFGFVHIWLDRDKTIALAPILTIGIAFLCVPILQTIRFPYYSSMKAVFVLPALIVMGVCIANAVNAIWCRKPFRTPLVLFMSLYAVIGISHVLLLLLTLTTHPHDLPGPIWPLPSLD